jgi:uncharacterized protein YndB with AHSA1/START domain
MNVNTSEKMIVDRDRRDVSMTRIFDAPRDLVFQVCLDPKLIPQWWGPRRLVTTVDHMDVRPSGTWRFIQKDEQGNIFAFHGEYREIDPPKRTVSTFEFEGMPGHVLVETTTFEDLGGKTKMTVHDVYATVEDLDGMVQSGMEEGAVESYDRLTELLRTLASQS